MDMQLIDRLIARSELHRMAHEQFGDLVKATVDVERGVMVVGGELHADEEAMLLDQGSKQSNLWGINLYPEAEGEDWIEFDSMINIRPSQGNRSRGVKDEGTRRRIVEIVHRLVMDGSPPLPPGE